MRIKLLVLGVFLSVLGSAQIPDYYLSPINSNISGNPISKGDTITMIVNYKNNSSTTRTSYFDFQYNYKLFTILGVTTGSAMPQGAQTSITNYFYPGYTYLRNTNNYTRNGNQNYNNCNYTYNQTSSNAIQRIYVTVSSASNLVDGSFIKVNLKVNSVSAGTTYDSLYMNFAAAWNSAGTYTSSNMPDPRATWVTLGAGQNELIKGNLYPNQAVSPYLIFTDTLNNATNIYPDVNGNFSVSTELKSNTLYKVQAAIKDIKTIAQSAITVSDATAVLNEFGSQNLDGTFNNTNLKTGAGYLAADINYNKKLDGADPYLLLSHVAGVDSLVPMVYLMPRDTFNLMTTSSWVTAPEFVYVRTTTSSQPLVLNYLIAGDVNRSHSSQVVDGNNNVRTFSYANTPIATKSPVDVSLSNIVSSTDYISIPFNVSSSSNVCGLQFELVYDETKLQLDTVTSATNASWLNFFKNEHGRLKFGGLDKTLANPLTGQVTPFIVRFKAISGSSISTLVQVTENVDASDNKGNQLGVNLNSNTIRIIGINNFK